MPVDELEQMVRRLEEIALAHSEGDRMNLLIAIFCIKNEIRLQEQRKK